MPNLFFHFLAYKWNLNKLETVTIAVASPATVMIADLNKWLPYRCFPSEFMTMQKKHLVHSSLQNQLPENQPRYFPWKRWQHGNSITECLNCITSKLSYPWELYLLFPSCINKEWIKQALPSPPNHYPAVHTDTNKTPWWQFSFAFSAYCGVHWNWTYFNW